MATYLKRTSKLFDFSLSRASGDVSLRDLMCPVCRGILIEPVTLPCTHNLCLRCLKGTFEHNSLSCPLCRVRVGSWLRTATKSESLVNNGLWDFIRAKFPKEVEDKHNGDDRDIDLDAGYTTANKILSAAGEIRREYEAELQMVEEERRCQRKVEEMASEALIRKIQAEEQQKHLVQLAEDQLLAKTLAKEQVAEEQSKVAKVYGEYSNISVPNCSLECSQSNINRHTNIDTSKVGSQDMDTGKMNLLELGDGSELRRSNMALISKIRAERYASSMQLNTNNVQKEPSITFCCQKPMPVYNAITRTSKQQHATKFIQPCTSSYAVETGTSTSAIYGTQTKEELHVPNDVVNNQKKSLGVEVCVTSGEDDERIGSAESSGSHDSINQEIHHFKPIKAMPRTPLKISTDGRQIDPKLIRVVPVFKRVSNVMPKPPSQTHFKRIIGCSWSAFRGKTRQYSREKDTSRDVTSDTAMDVEGIPSTSYEQLENNDNKSGKSQDIVRRLDFVLDGSYDSNKNYTKSGNRVFNGAKISKKLNSDEVTGVGKSPHKSWKVHVRNGMVGKYRRQKHVWINKAELKHTTNLKDEESDGKTSTSPLLSPKPSPQDNDHPQHIPTTGILPEGTKKRRSKAAKKESDNFSKLNSEAIHDVRRSTRKRLSDKDDSETSEEATSTSEKTTNAKVAKVSLSKSKRRRTTSRRTKLSSEESKEELDACTNVNEKYPDLRKSTRNSKHTNGIVMEESRSLCAANKFQDNTLEIGNDDCENSTMVAKTNNVRNIIDDDDIIEEQQRIERLVLQEKEDFELAQRLQAKFDEMESIAGRTRRSKKAIESVNNETDLHKIYLGRAVQKATTVPTAKSSIVNQTVNTEVRKRGRPPKRVK